MKEPGRPPTNQASRYRSSLHSPSNNHSPRSPSSCSLFCLMADLRGKKAQDNATTTVARKNASNASHNFMALATTTKQASSSVNTHRPGASNIGTPADLSRRRSGKELVGEMGTDEEKKAVVVNMAKARGAARKRFLAVGIFMSILTVSSKTLLDSMKKIWKIRGILDTNQLRDRRFVLEFSEEGDFNHVVRGGPWRYRDDAVLVDELKEGVDPETVQFNSVPIWCQFKEIPAYLLSKELARDLGSRIGTLVSIDNSSRGDILAKFIRARVRLPINKALRRWIPLQDETAEFEEVVVVVAYERLPKFCLYCGFIGHKEADCLIPENERKKRYSKDLRTDPILHDDNRYWFLPEIAGQTRHHHAAANPWRIPQGQAINPHAVVAQVTTEVGKLSVQDPPAEGEAVGKTRPSGATSPNTSTASKLLPLEGDKALVIVNTVNEPLPPKKSSSKWKRTSRTGEEGKGGKDPADTLTTQGLTLGAPRKRRQDEEEDESMLPMKKHIFHVPSLEACLGKEVLRRLREEDKGNKDDMFVAEKHGMGSTDSNSLEVTVESRDVETDDQTENHKEAAGPGAAGNLTGTKERACQEQ